MYYRKVKAYIEEFEMIREGDQVMRRSFRRRGFHGYVVLLETVPGRDGLFPESGTRASRDPGRGGRQGCCSCKAGVQ